MALVGSSSTVMSGTGKLKSWYFRLAVWVPGGGVDRVAVELGDDLGPEDLQHLVDLVLHEGVGR